MNKKDSLVFSALVIMIFVSIWWINSAFWAENGQADLEITGEATDQLENNVQLENNAPQISIHSPADNLNVTKGKTVNIVAAASDDEKVENLKLFINDTEQLTVKASQLQYNWDTINLSPGKYEIKILAEDGENSSEKTVSIVVKEAIKPLAAPAADKTPDKVAVNADASAKPNYTNVSRGSYNSSQYPLLSKNNGIFGQFRYRNTSGGRIEVDPQWVAENIVTITLPGLNQKVQVHKKAAANFIQAFNYIKDGTAVVNGKTVPLLSLVKTMDGTYVPRHVYWDSSRGLSNHSWGTAIDINAQGHFGYVDPNNKNDPNVILWEKAFKPAGFSWGNSYGDSMHFELIK